ncbi:AsmA family protein [Candidatus Margulisiibacteriota bacterium]
MKKFLEIIKKSIKWFFLIVVVLIVAAIVVLPKIFPLTKVANYAAQKAGDQIGRTISIKKASFNPFKGVSLYGIVISNDKRFSHRPMIDIKEVVLSYELMPLILQRRVVVKKAGIDGLELLYEKRGLANNFASLSQKKAGIPVAKTRVEDKVEEKRKPKEPIAMNIGKIFISNSKIDYIDYKTTGKKELNISDFNISLSNLSNDLAYSPAKLKGKVKISGAGNTSRIDLDGKITGPKAADMELKIDKLALDKLLSIFTNIKPKGTAKKAKKKGPPQELKIDFAPLRGYDLDFVAKLGEFTWGRMKVEDIKFKLGLHKMAFTFSNEAALYGGSVEADTNSALAKVPAPFNAVAKVNKIDGAKFLDEGLDMEGIIEGLLSADVNVKGKLNYPTKLTGSIMAKFEKGKIVDASKLLPGVPKEIFADLNGRTFDIFEMELILKDGKPTVGAIKGKGPNLDIDQNFNLDMDKVKKQLEGDIAKEKANIQAELDAKKKAAQDALDAEKQKAQDAMDAEKQKAQDALDAQKKEAEEKANEELQNQLNNFIKQ